MNQQRIIFETSEGFILLCVIVGIGYAFLLYSAKHPWSRRFNQILFGARAFVVFALAMFLMGPIIRQIKNTIKKPVFAIVQDDSQSIAEVTNPQQQASIEKSLTGLSDALTARGFLVIRTNLKGAQSDTVRYQAAESDIQGALQTVTSRNEGEKLAGALLVSDGIYNAGLSPLYAHHNFPIYTIGVGDTSQRKDVAIKNVLYNKIAYQGNNFPIRVEVLSKAIENRNLTVTLYHNGKELERQTKSIAADQLIAYDFQPTAFDKGFQKYEIKVATAAEEFNTRNNDASLFIEVVEGKKKILLVAPAPHPDIKAIRAVVEKNSNYEFILSIPGLASPSTQELDPAKIDLAIFLESPDMLGKTREVFQKFLTSKTSLFVIVGRQTDLQLLSKSGAPLKVESISRDYDDVTPVVNQSFTNFLLSNDINTILADYPPLSVPFGKIYIPATATPLLYQRIGAVSTDKPLLSVQQVADKKMAILLGEGIWRWRLDEFSRTEATIGFDELFGKLIQYLSTTDDKKKFKSYPVKQEFSEAEPVTIESQVYNDIYEPVYGNTVDLKLTDSNNKPQSYQYVLNPGNSRYQIGGLKEGIYQYHASTEINGVRENVKGQFAVTSKLAELQNLTADHKLLKKLSQNSGGKFFTVSSADKMQAQLIALPVENQIHSEESYDSIIQLKWIFWILLCLISIEWFLRKYLGGY